MGRNIILGRLFGIEFRVHYSWFIIFVLVTLYLVSPHYNDWFYWLIGILAALLLFASVLAHELAHSLVGRANGIPVSSITLFVFGGVSLMTREAPRPAAELKMAAAGPLCSIVLGAFFGVLLLIPGVPRPVGELLDWLAISNGGLAIFNLVPGFPLDGGRIFHSILWRVMRNYRLATKIAVRVGQGIGSVLVLGGILIMFFLPLGLNWFDGVWIAFIGWFLSSAATGSYRQMLSQEISLERNPSPSESSSPPGANQS